MVSVHVRDVNLVHLLGLIARRFQVGNERPEGVAKALTGACIDQDELCAGIDEISVVRQYDRIFEELT